MNSKLIQLDERGESKSPVDWYAETLSEPAVFPFIAYSVQYVVIIVIIVTLIVRQGKMLGFGGDFI